MRIIRLDKDSEQKYSDYLLRSPDTLLFASNKYRKLLKEFLKEEDIYLVALDEENCVLGILPTFLKINRTFGNTLNSLPFYGSNGSVIEFEGNEIVRKALVKEFYRIAEESKCVSTTLISSPLTPMEEFHKQETKYSLIDSRIGQITFLPEICNDLDESIMKMIHYKTRNLIRKAQKLDIKITHGEDKEYLDFLIHTHQENLSAIGGIAKHEDFFRLIPQHFKYGSDYKILVAKLNNEPIAALLLFYYNKTVEYYTPVIKAEFRNSQPMSLLIFEGMKDAVSNGFTRWNWGGTWTSQGGVYHFKSQWGTVDKNYYYYTKIFDKSILKRTKEELLKEYPYFFIAPFSALE